MNMTSPVPTHGDCMRVSQLLGRLGDRWTLPVVVTLGQQAMRFNQIRRVIEGISQQMLTRTLRTLERDGMVTRTVYPTVPPQVEYALTPLGRSLAEQGLRLGAWMMEHMAQIDGNRAVFDAAEAR